VEGTAEKRLYYMKGEKIVNFLVEPKKKTKWPTQLPKFSSRNEALKVCQALAEQNYIRKVDKTGKGEVKLLHPRFKSEFEEDVYFAWMYEGNKRFSHAMTTLLVVGFLACTCFPIWPNFLKTFVWYLSVTVLIFMFFLIIIRGLLFLFIWILGFDFWLLPNLFDEHLGVVDSFKPLYSANKSKEGQLYWRMAIFVSFFSFCYWAVTQPSEFDGFVAAQGDFIKDLYSGKLLSDISQADKDNIDKPKMPSLDDLLKTLDEDEEDEEKLSEEEAAEALLDKLMDQEDEDIDEDLDE